MYVNINDAPDYQNLNVLHKNTLKSRAYFIPAASEEECLACGNMRQSKRQSRFMLLSGKWSFAYFTSPALVPPSVVAGGEGTKWDKIDVPSCWQALGYEPPFYVNNDFTCPAVPPYVPNDNPTGVYKRKFTLPKNFDGKRVRLTFLGVCSAFHTYINGREVGYSQGSHNMSEFDVTDFLREGENDITVLVYKWSDGSFLESQDMFRYTGIFRDVYLTAVGGSAIFDFEFKTEHIAGGDFACNVSAEIENPAGLTLRLKLLGKGGETAFEADAPAEDGKLSFTVRDAALWSAETPNCYTLTLSLEKNKKTIECIGHTVGFTYIDYRHTFFKVNGAPIKIKGVNHHDTDPVRGYTVTLEDLMKDVELMKSLNVNTVRTSHYPPEPRFLELCTKFGLYVVDEADLESYGSINMFRELDYFGKNPQWRGAFLDRMEKLFYRDRNHACIIMFSLGNEAGIGANFDEAYRYLKERTSLPVQYETCFRDYDYPNERGYDIVSLMYPSIEKVEEWMAREDERPFYMCEYCHAMGVGPGSFKEYWDLIYQYDKFIGGCVWEWQDHAVYHKSGTTYTYGGDHGEYVHDSNFCCDGLIYPDKTLSPSAYEMKNVYRPIRARLAGFTDGLAEIELFNTQSFLSSGDITVSYTVARNGEVSESGKITEIVPAYSKKTVAVKLNSALESGEYLLTLRYEREGGEVGAEQLTLAESYERPVNAAGEMEVTEDEGKLVVRGNNKEITFDKYKCTIVSFLSCGVEHINQTPVNRGYNAYSGGTRGLYANIWKAPTDNDVRFKPNWHKHFYDLMFTSFYEREIVQKADRIEITVKGLLSPPKYGKKFDLVNKYTIFSDLSVEVESKLLPAEPDLPYLPRFGMLLEMPKGFDLARWYGLGERENYSDFKECALKGIYQKRVSEMRENYIRPQGSSSRCETDWFTVENADGFGLRIERLDRKLAFSCEHIPIEKLEKCAHREDVSEYDTTVVAIDGFLSGIGSNSCGPLPLPQYAVNAQKETPLIYSFRLSAIK